MGNTGGPEDLELRTARLLLRPWRPTDREPFASLNADPVVMEHFAHPLGRAESDRMVDTIEAHYAQRGLRLWAVEVLGEAPFIGYVGLSAPAFDAAFTPCVEVGWRLARDAWGHGYAHGGGASRARGRLQPSGPGRDRLLHHRRQPALPAGDGAPRHDAGPLRRLRSSQPPGRASVPPPRALPAQPTLIWCRAGQRAVDHRRTPRLRDCPEHVPSTRRRRPVRQR